MLRVIGPLWTDRHDTAKKVRQRLSLTFRWAMAAGYRTDNPTDEVLLAALPRNGAARRHMAALPTVEVPARASGHRHPQRRKVMDASGRYIV